MNNRRYVFLVITLELFQELETKNKYYNKRCFYIFFIIFRTLQGVLGVLPEAGDKDIYIYIYNLSQYHTHYCHKDIILYFYSYCMFMKITFIVY